MDRVRIECKDISYSRLRSTERIRSDFSTERVFRLIRESRAGSLTWTLASEDLGYTYHKLYDNGDPDDWLASYSDAGVPKELQFIAAEAGGRVQGLATSKLVGWNNTLWLIDLRIRENVRRSGIGSTLMDCLKVKARRRGVRGISVETQTNNYPAILFYQKHGFEIVGLQDRLYSNEDLERQDVALFLFWAAD